MKEVRGNQCLIVTPFTNDGHVDEPSTRRLIDHCIDGNGQGILALGTIGEFYAMSRTERRQFMDIVGDQVAGRVTLGISATDTTDQAAVELARHAESVGADWIMLAAPYHKPSALTTTAVTRYVSAVADAVEVPVFLYDGGGGYEFALELILQLARRHSNVRGAKMSGAEPAKISQLHAELGPDFTCLAGNPPKYFMMLAHGATGISSAMSNFLHSEGTEMCRLVEQGEMAAAREIYCRQMLPLLVHTSASVVKQLLYWEGTIDSCRARLPNMPLGTTTKREILGIARLLGHELPNARLD